MLQSRMPNQDNNETFLSQFGKSGESKEFYSPIPDGYKQGHTRYVVVLGTVMSGLGKGIFSSSLAKLLQDKGLTVTPVKLEGYLNIDSGTLNPFRHGEVFVLDDGTETDMDLGTYERILDQNLSNSNFTTAGQIYTEILTRERAGGYLGRDVQMIPHVTGEVKRRLRQLAIDGGKNGKQTDVVFVEVGGTVGDYENGFYIEALRELAYEEGPESTCFVALTYIVEPAILGEQKSKPAQLGIKRLMETGIQPHLVACRAELPVTETVIQKISMFSNVPKECVFSMHDRASIYTIPDAMRSEGLDRQILSQLKLHNRVDAIAEDKARSAWNAYTTAISSEREYNINIGLLGKYTSIRDAYASIDKAIEHSSTHLSANVNIKWLDVTNFTAENADSKLEAADLDAVIVPGGFGERGIEGKLASVKWAREHGIPFLGICLGFQMAVVEFARNVVELKDANSAEFDVNCAHPVIAELPDQKEIEGLGGTMRLGGQDVELTPGSFANQLFGSTSVRQRFRHRYEVEPKYIDQLTKAGLIFSGHHPEHQIMQVLELSSDVHPYFVAGQFHPELTSRPLRPQPMFMGLVAAAIVHKTGNTNPEHVDSRWLSGSNSAANV
jgi:CTP synthase